MPPRRKTFKRIYGGSVNSGNNRKTRWTFKRPSTIPYEKVLGKRGCNPGNTGSDDSCIPLTDLKEFAKEVGVEEPINRSSLCKSLNCKEDSDKGLLGSAKMTKTKKEEWLKKFFRPPPPEEWKSDPDSWLDNHSMEAVLKQYEEADPTFKSLGAVPIDFAAPSPYGSGSSSKKQCLLPEFCNTTLESLKKDGKTGMGAIFNLDPHFKDGSHWVSFYLDVNTPAAYYFDSYGLKPPKQIRLLMETFWSQDNRCKLAYNGRRFQYGKSECGMYSLFFITCMHYGIKFQQFVKHRVPDNVMLFLRSWFFNTDLIETKQEGGFSAKLEGNSFLSNFFGTSTSS